jgi:hypothetical protein
MKHQRLIMAFVAAVCLWAGGSPAFAITESEYNQLLDGWKKTRQAAVEEADRTGKNILLFAGHYGCSFCENMNILINRDSTRIKSLIQEYFIPWYCNTRDPDEGIRVEWQDYPDTIGTPYFCVIDPDKPEKVLGTYLLGQRSESVFYDWLFNLGPPLYLRNAILALQVVAHITTSGVAIKDIDGDRKIGMAEAIYSLQKAAGLR